VIYTLAVSEWNNLLAVAQLATPVVVGGLGWLIKRAINDIDRRQQNTEHRVLQLERNTVGKEEWLRDSNISRMRQEKILEDLAELKGQNRAGVEIGSAVAAALNRRSEM